MSDPTWLSLQLKEANKNFCVVEEVPRNGDEGRGSEVREQDSHDHLWATQLLIRSGGEEGKNRDQ